LKFVTEADQQGQLFTNSLILQQMKKEYYSLKGQEFTSVFESS